MTAMTSDDSHFWRIFTVRKSYRLNAGGAGKLQQHEIMRPAVVALVFVSVDHWFCCDLHLLCWTAWMHTNICKHSPTDGKRLKLNIAQKPSDFRSVRFNINHFFTRISKTRIYVCKCLKCLDFAVTTLSFSHLPGLKQ